MNGCRFVVCSAVSHFRLLPSGLGHDYAKMGGREVALLDISALLRFPALGVFRFSGTSSGC